MIHITVRDIDTRSGFGGQRNVYNSRYDVFPKDNMPPSTDYPPRND